MRTLAWLPWWVGLAGCQTTDSAARAIAAESRPEGAATDAPADEPEPGHASSIRCRECHARQRDEWVASAHARSASGAYRRALALVDETGRDTCAGCHVPLAGAPARIADEGVACDACHTAVGGGLAPRALALRPELATKFGPYRDSQDHHFHRVAYSEFVTSAALCIACHEETAPLAAAPGLRVLTSVAEWRTGPSADVACQECHMPKLRAKACKAGDERTVARHDFGGDRRSALAAALRLTLRIEERGVGRRAHITVENHGAGHALPSGLPERRMRLTVEVETPDAHRVVAEEAYGRVLIDEQGSVAPFFLATRERSDRRLLPGRPRHARVDLAPDTRRVTARLTYRRWDSELAVYYGDTETLLLAEVAEEVR
jgi:hypothetical protein